MINKIKIIWYVVIIILAFYHLSINNKNYGSSQSVLSSRTKTLQLQISRKDMVSNSLLSEKKILINNFFQNIGFVDSPLNSEKLIQISESNNIDYRLLVAIAGVESGFCRNGQFPSSSHNCFGWGGTHLIHFSSYEEAYEHIGKSLARHYELSDIDSIAKKYNPGSWEDWSGKVRLFIKKIDSQPYEGRPTEKIRDRLLLQSKE